MHLVKLQEKIKTNFPHSLELRVKLGVKKFRNIYIFTKYLKDREQVANEAKTNCLMLDSIPWVACLQKKPEVYLEAIPKLPNPPSRQKELINPEL